MINFYKLHNKELNSITGIEIRDGGLVIGIFNNKEIILCPKETEKRLNWTGAIEYCNELNYNGYNDWVLPDKEELNFIYQNLYKTFQLPEYQFPGDHAYWSSTEKNSDNAWYQFLPDGYQFYLSKYIPLSVRVIRTQ